MRPRQFSRSLLFSLFVAMTVTALGQENGDGGQQTESGNDSEHAPHMAIVHKGPGRPGDGLSARFPDQARELEAQGESFTGLFLAPETSEQQGGAVIIPDIGGSPAHGLPAGLRQALPESGWSTLAIALPSSMIEPLPKRVFGTRSEASGNASETEASPQQDNGNQDAEEGKEAEGEGDEADTMTIEVTQGQREEASGEARNRWQDAAMARVGAAVQMLRDQGIQNLVLIGRGAGADLALRYADANGATFPPGGLGLVWLDARLRTPYDQPLDEVLGEGYAVPVMDLHDRDRSGERARARQVAAQRGGFENYTQSALPMPRHSRNATKRRLGSWVAGWLNENMAGMETE